VEALQEQEYERVVDVAESALGHVSKAFRELRCETPFQEEADELEKVLIAVETRLILFVYNHNQAA
jgi:hypothetical protein